MKQALTDLRLDRRMTARPRWISKKDLEASLEALPDVSDKIDRSPPPSEQDQAEPAPVPPTFQAPPDAPAAIDSPLPLPTAPPQSPLGYGEAPASTPPRPPAPQPSFTISAPTEPGSGPSDDSGPEGEQV